MLEVLSDHPSGSGDGCAPIASGAAVFMDVHRGCGVSIDASEDRIGGENQAGGHEAHVLG